MIKKIIAFAQEIRSHMSSRQFRFFYSHVTIKRRFGDTHAYVNTLDLITWDKAPATKTMTIYIDDDWNACAPVRKMTWVNQLSGYETRQRTEARMTVGSLRTASDRKNATRSLYANSLTCDMRAASSRASAIVKKKTSVIANIMTSRVALVAMRIDRASRILLRSGSNYAYRSQSILRTCRMSRKESSQESVF